MNTFKGTPGPWVWGEDFRGLGSANGEVLTYLDYEGMWLSYGINREANARLIAASPELLEELQNALSQMEMAAQALEKGNIDEAMLHVCSLRHKKQAAISKALGEQHDS